MDTQATLTTEQRLYPFPQRSCCSQRMEYMRFGNCFINIDIIVVLTSVIQSYQQWQRSPRVQSHWPVWSFFSLISEGQCFLQCVGHGNHKQETLLSSYVAVSHRSPSSYLHFAQLWAWNISLKRWMPVSGLLNSIFLHTLSELILLAKVVDGLRNTEGVHFWQTSLICNVGGYRTQGFLLNWKQWNVI